MNLYFPTIKNENGEFAGVFEDTQVVFCDRFTPMRPVQSLKTIKKQIEKSVKYRRAQGWLCEPSEYGYMRIKLNEEKM